MLVFFLILIIVLKVVFCKEAIFAKTPEQIKAQSDSPYVTSFKAEWHYGVVPYYIDTDSYDNNLKRRIQKAMAIVEGSSCVIFKEETEKPKYLPKPNSIAWLHFTNPQKQRECSHDTAKGVNGDTIIVLGIDCLRTSEVLHSVLHGLGFKDEVTHPHRDQYVRILWENVKPSYRSLFRVRSETAPNKLVEYDPMSIMHFHDRAYSENGGLTIAPAMPGLAISPSDKLSQLDVMKLRIMYGHECNKRKVGDLIDNCKNVLYHQKLRTKDQETDDDKQQNATEEGKDVDATKEEDVGHKKYDATKEDDGDATKEENDVDATKEEIGGHKTLNAPEERKDVHATKEEVGGHKTLDTPEERKDVHATKEEVGGYKTLDAPEERKDVDATKEEVGGHKTLDAPEERKDVDATKEEVGGHKTLDAREEKDGYHKQLKATEEGVLPLKAELDGIKQKLTNDKEGYQSNHPLFAYLPQKHNENGGRRRVPFHMWKYNKFNLH